MENEEKIMTDQDIIQEKNPNAEPASRTLQATQVVDADQGADVHAESHDSSPVDTEQEADINPESFPIEISDQTTDNTDPASQIVDAPPVVDALPETAADAQADQPVQDSTPQPEAVTEQARTFRTDNVQSEIETKIPSAQALDTQSEVNAQFPAPQIVDAPPEANGQVPTPQNVDTLPEADSQTPTPQVVNTSPEANGQVPTPQVVDTSPEADSQTPTPQIVDADQTPQAEEDIPTVSFNAKNLKNHTEKLLSKIKPAKRQQSTQVVTADSVQAEEVPTIPIGSLQSLSALEPEVSVHSVASMRAVGMPAPLVVQPSEYRRGLGEWLEIWRDGIRPAYLPLSLMPILLGSALAWTQTISSKRLLGHFDVVSFVLALVAAIIIQTGAHLINDYYDYQRGIDTSNVLGPGGLLQQGLIKPARLLTIGLVFLVVGSVFGLGAAYKGGVLVCLFGLAIVLGAYFFSATKKALSSLGLGELVGFVAFGLLPTMGAYMIQTRGVLTSQVFDYSLPLGFLAAATIYANNMRDIEGDSHVGKRTLATILGLRFSRTVYSILMIVAYVIVLTLGVPHAHPHFILIALWTLPGLVVAITGAMRTEISAGFHDVMRQTLKIYTLFTILLIIGLFLSAFIPALPKIPSNLITFP